MVGTNTLGFMACKLHEFRFELIRTVLFDTKQLAESQLLRDTYFKKKHYRDLYKTLYVKYYPKFPEHEYLFLLLGSNLDNLINTFWTVLEDAEYTQKGAESTISEFIENQFALCVENTQVFYCNCGGTHPFNERLCPGDGTCIAYCKHLCNCNHSPCICSHNKHRIFCETQCPHKCVPKRCHNHGLCNRQMPQWAYEMYGGLCPEPCRWRRGRMRHVSDASECPICNDASVNVEIACGHRLCYKCWKQITNNASPTDSATCPFCRGQIVDLSVKGHIIDSNVRSPVVDSSVRSPVVDPSPRTQSV